METFNLLPFPIIPETSPVEKALTDERSIVYYVNLPMKIFQPAMSRMSEGTRTRLYISHMRLITYFIHLFQKELAQNKQQFLENNLPRLSLYIEYLLSNEKNIENPIEYSCPLLGCVGIRLLFCVNDPTVNIAELIATDITERKEKNKNKKKSTKSNDVSQLYDFFTSMTSLYTWIDDSFVYSGMDQPMVQDYSIYISEDKLNPTSELFPTNVFHCNSGIIRNIHPRQSDYDDSCLKFAFPKMVFRIPSAITSPAAILAMTLPLTIKWSNQDDSKRKETIQILHSQDALHQYYVSGFIKRNDIRDLRDMFVARMKIAESNEHELIRQDTVKALQEIWCPEAHVSEPIKKMSLWSKELGTWTIDMPHIYDTELSYFGNMIAEEMIGFEKELRIATSHTIFLKLLVASMNAYWYKKGKLHLNLLLLGSGATGKSFIFDTLQDLLIPDTVTKVSHQTEKAMTVDTDRNDHITIYHECPPTFLGAGTKGSDQQTGSHLIKDMLTSCEVKTETIFVDSESQRRYSVSCSSECIGVIFMATNERSDSIPEALSSRTMKIQVNTMKRDLFNIQAKSNQFNVNTNTDSIDQLKKRWRIRQCMVNMVEKMIYIGLLDEPNMMIADIMFSKVIDALKTKGIVTDNADSVRNLNFMQMFTRSLTILFAVDKYARDPHSPGYYKPFEFKYLQDIKKYLVCTEEIALFALTMLNEQLIESSHFHIVELILLAFGRNIHRDGDMMNIKGRSELGNRILLYQTLLSTQSRTGTKVRISAENLKVGFVQLTKEYYRGEPIISLNEECQTMKLNAHYIDNNYKMNRDGSYYCTISPSTIITDMFYTTYSHRYFEPGRMFLLSTIVDINYPFLLETISLERNQQNIIEIHNQSIEFENDDSDETAFIPIKDSLEKIVCEKASTDTISLYNYPGYHMSDSIHRYPHDIIKKFAYKHGVSFADSKNERKYSENEQVIKMHHINRKRKLESS